MAWLREVKRERKNKLNNGNNRELTPHDIIRAYGLGKPIHYSECWRCSIFYRYERCPYRFWLGTQLYCIKKAIKIDSRLKHGLR